MPATGLFFLFFILPDITSLGRSACPHPAAVLRRLPAAFWQKGRKAHISCYFIINHRIRKHRSWGRCLQTPKKDDYSAPSRPEKGPEHKKTFLRCSFRGFIHDRRNACIHLAIHPRRAEIVKSIFLLFQSEFHIPDGSFYSVPGLLLSSNRSPPSHASTSRPHCRTYTDRRTARTAHMDRASKPCS